MMNPMLLLTMLLLTMYKSEAFYKAHTYKAMPTVTPTTLEEVKKALCSKMHKGKCEDIEPTKIIINQIFDFTDSEGRKEEMGCYHKSKPKECFTVGQVQLNVANQCDGLVPTKVTYNVAGRQGLDVGSNKIIIGQKGGGFKGKGFRLKDSYNVEIKDLTITEINAAVIWGGDAVDLLNVKNVLIDGNYFHKIGRQMIVSHFGSNTGLTISNNVFDGRTNTSSHCNGGHYWLWLILGQGDQITFQNNVIFETTGRGPHLVASGDSKSIIHIIQNIFYNIKDMGLVELEDKHSSVLLEGNIFYNVHEIVHKNEGHVFLVQDSTDQQDCKSYLGRQCLLNTIIKSGGTKVKNSLTVLKDLRTLKDHLTEPISMKKKMTTWVTLPDYILKLLNKL